MSCPPCSCGAGDGATSKFSARRVYARDGCHAALAGSAVSKFQNFMRGASIFCRPCTIRSSSFSTVEFVHILLFSSTNYIERQLPAKEKLLERERPYTAGARASQLAESKFTGRFRNADFALFCQGGSRGRRLFHR